MRDEDYMSEGVAVVGNIGGKEVSYTVWTSDCTWKKWFGRLFHCIRYGRLDCLYAGFKVWYARQRRPKYQPKEIKQIEHIEH